MFKFFQAIANLTQSVQALADSFTEANARLRTNILDAPPAEVPSLEHDEDRPARRNGRKAGV